VVLRSALALQKKNPRVFHSRSKIFGAASSVRKKTGRFVVELDALTSKPIFVLDAATDPWRQHPCATDIPPVAPNRKVRRRFRPTFVGRSRSSRCGRMRLMGRKAWIDARWIAAIKSPTDLRVMLAIAAHAGTDGTGARPSVETIRELAGLGDRRSVRRCITRLIAAGYLVADRKGGRKASRYTIRQEGPAKTSLRGLKTSPQDGLAESSLMGVSGSDLSGPPESRHNGPQRSSEQLRGPTSRTTP
jgi:hypothetical protein